MISIVLDRVDKNQYATFESVADMRESVNAHVKKIQESGLSAAWQKKLIRLLDYLRDQSRTFFGLSWKKQRLIAKHFGLKKPDTVGIWLKKLADLGIVKVLPTKRSCSMQQTANFVQILPAEIEKRGQAQSENGEPEVNTSSKTKSIITNTYPKPEPLNFYGKFKKFIHQTIGENQSVVSRLFGVYRGQSDAFLKYGAFSHEEVEHVAYEALRASVMRSKTKKIRNIAGYYNGVLDKMLDQLYLAAINEE